MHLVIINECGAIVRSTSDDAGRVQTRVTFIKSLVPGS